MGSLGDCLESGGKLFIELINRDWIVRKFQARGWWQAVYIRLTDDAVCGREELMHEGQKVTAG